MVTREATKDDLTRRDFIKRAATAAASIGAGSLMSFAGEKDAVEGPNAKKLAAIKPEDLQNVTFMSLATHPSFEPDKSSKPAERKMWTEVMSAVFPEGLDTLLKRGWVRYDQSKATHVFASDAPKLRLATAHLFAIRKSEVGGAKASVRQYAEFIANTPLQEATLRGTSPHEMYANFFDNGGDVGVIKTLDAQARAWEKENGIKLKGGSTLEGVSVVVSIQDPELYSPDLGGVRVALMKREHQPRQIVQHGRGLVDAAMMKDAVRARYDALTGEKGEWQRGVYGKLRTDAKLSAKMDALDATAGRKTIPDETFLDAVMDVASASLAAKPYPEDMRFINGFNTTTLLLESSLIPPAERVQYPGYKDRPRTKATAASDAVLAVKGAVLAKAMGDADLEARYRSLSESFLSESDVKPETLSQVEGVFQGISDALGGRRKEFMDALKKAQDAPETAKATQEARKVSGDREAYLSNMAPLKRVDFVDSAFDGAMALEKAVGEK
jgi:hypothetical protein